MNNGLSVHPYKVMKCSRIVLLSRKGQNGGPKVVGSNLGAAEICLKILRNERFPLIGFGMRSDAK